MRGISRSSNHALASPMTAPVATAVSSRAACVGTRRTTQWTSSAAPIHPPVIQSVDRMARAVRRETTGRVRGIGSGHRAQHQLLELDDQVLAASQEATARSQSGAQAALDGVGEAIV